MIEGLKIIKGEKHIDQRGELSFVNDFDMSEVKRFYRIKNYDIDTIRGWRGHKIEQRWFHVLKGAFIVNLVEIDNWDAPSQHLKQATFKLDAKDMVVLHMPVGYASSIKAIENDSEMIVFGDYSIEHAPMDDYLFPVNYFKSSQNLLNEN